MHTILQYTPGQIATVTLSIYDNTGKLSDGYGSPVVSNIILPNLTQAPNFPLPMNKISTGLYQFKFQLAVGALAVGSYIVVMEFQDPSGNLKNEVLELLVNAPFANFSVSPG